MPGPNTATRQSDWYYEISGFTGTWATGSAPTLAGQSTPVADGGGPKEKLPDDPTWNDMTFSRPYRRGRDGATMAQAKARYGQQVTVTGYCKTPDGVISETVTIIGTIGGLTGAAGDRMSGQPATAEIPVNVDDVIFG